MNTSNANLSVKTPAFRKTFKAVSSVDSLSTLENFKSFRVMRNQAKSSANFDAVYIVHKSSLNFKDRVEAFTCKHCNSLTLITPCNCFLVH